MKHSIKIGALLLLAAAITLLPISGADTQRAALSAGSNPAGAAQEGGDDYSKEEVIYAVLDSAGHLTEAYAVNSFELTGPAVITDAGDYTQVLKLSGEGDVQYDGQTVQIQGAAGRLYYQGKLSAPVLPWLFSVRYYLDGEALTADQLSGRSGALAIEIGVEKNGAAEPGFYDHYMLQLTLTLDGGKCSQIEAKDAVVACAGENRTLAFTLLPGQEALYTVTAQVTDFSMAGLQIAGLPYTVSAQLPETSGLTEGFADLAQALRSFGTGIDTLASGAAELKTGTAALYDGSARIETGLTQLKSGAEELTAASAAMQAGLQTASETLSTGGAQVEGLQALPDTLRMLSQGLMQAEEGLSSLAQGFSTAYAALDKAMQALPDEALSEEQLAALYAGAGQAEKQTLDQLVGAYTAAMTAKGTYDKVQAAFAAAEQSLPTLCEKLKELAQALQTMAQTADGFAGAELSSLLGSLETLAKGYDDFHQALCQYTGGVSKAADEYGDFHAALSAVNGGADGLSQGADTLSQGAATLLQETAGLQEGVQQKIDEMLSGYTGEEYEPRSFLSPDNRQVRLVQFVIKTQGVPAAEQPAESDTPDDEPLSFWQRLIGLFK